jgi:hypothetical protein
VYAPTQAPASSSQSTLEDILKAFMQLTGQSINDVKNSTMVNTQAIAKYKFLGSAETLPVIIASDLLAA